MRAAISTVMGMVVAAGLALTPAATSAQAPGLDPQRDCMTIRTCNFTRGGAVRGCLSSYSCRWCRLVKAPCTVGRPSRTCQEMRCGWG